MTSAGGPVRATMKWADLGMAVVVTNRDDGRASRDRGGREREP